MLFYFLLFFLFFFFFFFFFLFFFFFFFFFFFVFFFFFFFSLFFPLFFFLFLFLLLFFSYFPIVNSPSTGWFTPTDGNYEDVDASCNILQVFGCIYCVRNSLTFTFFIILMSYIEICRKNIQTLFKAFSKILWWIWNCVFLSFLKMLSFTNLHSG